MNVDERGWAAAAAVARSRHVNEEGGYDYYLCRNLDKTLFVG